MLSVYTMGGLRFVQGDKPISTLGSQKAEALFIYLVIERRPIYRETLAAMFWPESPHSKALSSLRVALTKLRKYFTRHLVITRDTVELNPNETIYVDILDIEKRIKEGNVELVLPLIKGGFLEGFEINDSAVFEQWLTFEKNHIELIIIDGLKKAASVAIFAKDSLFGLNLVRQVLRMDPIDEEAHRQFMILSVLNDDKNGALDQYDKFKSILKEELGITPSKETQILYETIKKNNDQTLFDFHLPENNLPVKQSSFVGRQADFVKVSELIQDRDIQIITITGPGGVGKTRLAVEIARFSLPLFKNGCFFVPLEDLPGVEFIIPAIAKAIHFNFDTIATQQDAEEQLIDYLYHREILLILDGFDTLIPYSDRISSFTKRLPGMKLLITSRQPMHIGGEWIYKLSGLSTKIQIRSHSVQQIDSVKLFVDRAMQVGQNFLPSSKEFQRIKNICKLIEGMPLAIEMAAGWTSIYPVEEIEKEITENLDFLITSLMDVPEKHRSIRGVFKSSWRLLTPEQQDIFCKIAIFPGDFDRTAALMIADISIGELCEFTEKSLIEKDQAGRFKLHQLIKQFVFNELIKYHDLYKRLQNRYCGYYLDMLNNSVENLMGSLMVETRANLRKELHHIFTSIQWEILHGTAEISRKALNSLVVFIAVHGWHEGIEMFRILEKERTKFVLENDLGNSFDDPIILICRIHQGFLLSNLGQIKESEEVTRPCLEALSSLNLSSERSVCLHNMGVNASFRGEYEIARQLLENAIIIGKDSQYILWPTYLLWLGHVYFLLGEYEQGLLGLKKCRDIFLGQGTLWGAAFAISKMGLAAEGLGDHQQALQYHQDAFAMFEKFENEAGKGYSLSRMSMSAFFLKKFDSALRFSTQACDVFTNLSHRWGLSSSLSRKGFAYLGLGSFDLAHISFLDALEISKENQMAPLSLYALAGISCVKLQKGHQKSALELFVYLQKNPKMVKAYLAQAIFWINEMGVSLFGTDELTSCSSLCSMNLSEVVDFILAVEKSSNFV